MVRRVYRDDFRAGMVLASAILSDGGLFLLSEGVVLNDDHLRLLRSNGVPFIHVREGEVLASREGGVPPLIPEGSMAGAVEALKGAFASAAQGDEELLGARLEGLIPVVAEIQDQVLSQPEMVAHCQDLRGHDDYTFRHSVHVMVISLLMGKALEMPEGMLTALAMGAVLHDIGKTQIPVEILNKPGRLSPEEMRVMRRHPEMGAEMLEGSRLVPPESRRVLAQHHERWDGSGYPLGLKGREIHPFARQVAVADVYDALASARPYKTQRFAHEVYRYVRCQSGTLFDPKVVEVFSRVTTPYPVGTWMLLSSGHVGMVTRVERGNTLRPEVTVVHHTRTGTLSTPLVLDLAAHPRLQVRDILPAEPGYEVCPR